jgi:hypothetical protein
MRKLRKYHEEAKELKSLLVPGHEYRKKEVVEIATDAGIDKKVAEYIIYRMLHQPKPGSPIWFLPKEEAPVVSPTSIAMRSVASVVDDEIYVPEKVKEYVKWGEFNSISKIVKSKMFYPIYISGPSGNGKTMMVEQVCANTGREYVRAQISPETDEDDLIGGFRLINGETVFQKGPVIKAMEKGCILLIDEIDRATNKIMCLQGVLEGNPVLLKKTGEVIKPAPGFNVIATANTKGRGSSDGRYTAATIIDDAFLERFVAAIDQPFPSPSIEKKIVKAHMEKFDALDETFLDKLIAWSNVIRKTFDADGVDEVISTRRLCHITKTFAIFNDKMKSINLCISRFDEETKEAFLDLYSKIDETAETDDSEDLHGRDMNYFEDTSKEESYE